MARCILQLVLGCWNTGATQESAVGLSKPLGRLLAHRRKMWVLGSALLSASSDRCSQQPQLQHTLAECVPLAPAVPQAGHDSRLPGDVRNVTVTHRGELWGYGRGSLSAALSGGHLTTPAQPPNACPGRGRWWRGATGAAGPLASRARPPRAGSAASEETAGCNRSGSAGASCPAPRLPSCAPVPQRGNPAVPTQRGDSLARGGSPLPVLGRVGDAHGGRCQVWGARDAAVVNPEMAVGTRGWGGRSVGSAGSGVTRQWGDRLWGGRGAG